MSLHGGGLGVEGDSRRCHQNVQQFTRLRLGRDEPVVVRNCFYRLQFFGGRSGRRFGRGDPRIVEEFTRQSVQLELRANRREFLAVGLLEAVVVPVHLEGNVRADCREELRDPRIFRSGEDALGEFALDLADVRNDALDVAELRKQVRRRLLADTAYAGNVVGGVPCKREVVNHLQGVAQMPVFADLRDVENLRRVARTRGTVEAHARTHQLRGVLVGRREKDLEPGRRPLRGERADDVIRLEAGDAHDGNAQRLRQFERLRNRGGDVLRHLVACRLVGRIGLVTERRPARIHRQHDVRRLLVLDD